MNDLDSTRLVTLKRCPQCKKPDLTFINLFTIREFERREYVDLYCPNCLIVVEKDKYGRVINVTNFGNKQNEKRSHACFLLAAPKKRPPLAFLIKRSDLHG